MVQIHMFFFSEELFDIKWVVLKWLSCNFDPKSWHFIKGLLAWATTYTVFCSIHSMDCTSLSDVVLAQFGSHHAVQNSVWELVISYSNRWRFDLYLVSHLFDSPQHWIDASFNEDMRVDSMLIIPWNSVFHQTQDESFEFVTRHGIINIQFIFFQ